MGLDGFDVTPEELTRGANTIRNCVRDLPAIDLEGVVGQSEWYGHDALHGAVTQFARTWNVAITLLRERADSCGDGLDGVARAYSDQEQTATGSIQHRLGGLPPY